MQVILPDEQIHQLQLLISQLIENEITNKLDSNNIKSPFLNKQQTCTYLGISNNTLDSWIQKGLPIIRIGKTVRFDKNEIKRWLQNQ
ncbi:TPA: helix-turn-helix domain-containing protein [Streptococcus mutans]|uniref:helix-turn-helix transcriptional regulator n=1 Tax=Streptococcus mutans TaxID=1309 RepID=UPI0002B5377C|nr:helix-turn-helix domain-containing protein [Streptococcus mutans]AYO48665.1 DNA-binding protein [Streptococcus mutans]EMB80599.1 DNA-binding protein [Streptococcus mutans NFSM2]EMC20270.1 DNA-binding protein [Streptococcus mutans SF1]MCB4942060.1 helix-turn-helix domain-containing protein [Streptococcus mutans]MCB4951139.1 helix-turn-helix domain-containing protein [Streptococcus mutans]